MKIEVLSAAMTFIGGLTLGVIFYYGLWLTIKTAVKSQIPSLWFFGSFLFRTIVTLTGFLLISRGSWQHLVLCLCGFTVARYLIKYLTRVHVAKNQAQKREQ